MKIRSGALIWLAVASSAGCSVGPDVVAPHPSTPTRWSEPLAGGETGTSTSIATWWTQFHDPELESLIARALKSNLDLRMAEAKIHQARAQRGLAEADQWPTTDATGSLSRERQSEHQPLLGTAGLPSGASLETGFYQLGFDASWELDVFGGTRRAVEAADAELAAAMYSGWDAQVALVAEVARTYAELRGDQRRLKIARSNTASQRESVAVAHNRFLNGVASHLDFEQATTLLHQTEAQVPVLESDLRAAIHRLGVLLGQPPGALATELATDAPIPMTPPDVPVGLPSDLLLRRPDIRSAERSLAAATARIGVATADLFPKFSLTGEAGLQTISADTWLTSSSRIWSIGPTVQWRIFDAGRIRANIRVQDARQEQALVAYEQAVLSGFEDVENALVAYAREQDRNLSLQAAVKTSQNALQISGQLYARGLTNYINVLDAERSLYQIEDDLARSDLAVTRNLIALYKALGGGWEEGAEARHPPVSTAEPRP